MVGQSEFVEDSTQFNMVPKKKNMYYINDGLLLCMIIQKDSIFLFFLTPPRSFLFCGLSLAFIRLDLFLF